jgi:hypothetical protein
VQGIVESNCVSGASAPYLNFITMWPVPQGSVETIIFVSLSLLCGFCGKRSG